MRKKQRFSQFKDRAMALRAEGKTYSEIISTLGADIPKSTLSDWCCKVAMPDWYQKKVDELNNTNRSKALKIAHASNTLKREKVFAAVQARSKDAISKIQFDKNIYKVLLAMLYLGEGSKGSSGLGLGNTNPNIIQMYIAMLSICYGIDPKDLKCKICYRADQDLQVLEGYWSDITGIPLENFYHGIPDPRTIGKPTKREDYRGVCVIYGGGKAIQLEFKMLSELILDKVKMGL